MKRSWLIAVVVILILNVGLLVADWVTDSGQVAGPTGSSYVTTGEGTAAWHDSLGLAGYPVDRTRTPIDKLDPATTLVILEPAPDRLSAAELREIREFVSEGGRLVAGGALPNWLNEITSGSLEWSPSPVGTATAVRGSPETEFVEVVAFNSLGIWTAIPAGTTPLLTTTEGEPVVVSVDVGAGRMILAADVTPFLNAAIGAADNAAFAFAVVGENGRPVVFNEYVHGFADSEGLSGLPESWLWALGLGLVALAAYLLSIGRRLGPPEIIERDLAPARREYLDALAGTLARSADHGGAIARVRQQARAEIGRRAKLDVNSPAAYFREAAARLGLSDDEVQALLTPDQDDETTIAAGRALAKLSIR